MQTFDAWAKLYPTNVDYQIVLSEIHIQSFEELIRELTALAERGEAIIDWGDPTRADRWLNLDDYIDGYINNCVDFIRSKHNLNSINLLGICQGGTFSLCYSAIYPEKVKNLIVMVTPVDFHLSNSLLNMQDGCTLGAEAIDVDLMVEASGNISGDYLNSEFLMLKPCQLVFQKYIDFLEIIDSEDKLLNFLRMEKWIFGSPDHPGEAYRSF